MQTLITVRDALIYWRRLCVIYGDFNLTASAWWKNEIIIKRIKFLEEKLNKSSTILTTNYNPNYKKVYDKFKQQGIITENLKIDNIYDWLADYKLLENQKRSHYCTEDQRKPQLKYLG